MRLPDAADCVEHGHPLSGGDSMLLTSASITTRRGSSARRSAVWRVDGSQRATA